MNTLLLVAAASMVAQAPPSRPARVDGPAVRVAVRFCSQHSCSRIQYGSGMVTMHKKNGEYVVMTNFHVIRPVPHMTRKVWVMAHGNWYDAKVGAVGSNDVDIALLTIKPNGPLAVTPLSDMPAPDGAQVTIVSFRGRKRYMRQEGRIYDRSTTGGNIDGSDFLTVKIDDGQSGGGVLYKGKVVALVYGVDKPARGMRAQAVRHTYSGMGLCVDYSTMRNFATTAGYKFKQYDEPAPAPPAPPKEPFKEEAVPKPVDTAPPEPPPQPTESKPEAPPKPVVDEQARKGIKELGGKVTGLAKAVSNVAVSVKSVTSNITNIKTGIEVSQSKDDERFGLLKGLVEKAIAPRAPADTPPSTQPSVTGSAPGLLTWLGTAAGLSATAASGVGVAGSIGLWLYRRRKKRHQGGGEAPPVQPHNPPVASPSPSMPYEPAVPVHQSPYSPPAAPPLRQPNPPQVGAQPQVQVPNPTQAIGGTENRYVPVLQPDTYREAVQYAHAKLVGRYPESEGTVAFIDNVVDQYLSGHKQ